MFSENLLQEFSTRNSQDPLQLASSFPKLQALLCQKPLIPLPATLNCPASKGETIFNFIYCYLPPLLKTNSLLMCPYKEEASKDNTGTQKGKKQAYPSLCRSQSRAPSPHLRDVFHSVFSPPKFYLNFKAKRKLNLYHKTSSRLFWPMAILLMAYFTSSL